MGTTASPRGTRAGAFGAVLLTLAPGQFATLDGSVTNLAVASVAV